MSTRTSTPTHPLSSAWWEAWRLDDYSWLGLAQKTWPGWLWSEKRQTAYPESSAPKRIKLVPATLQHYWWDLRNSLVDDPSGHRQYTIAHLPICWSDGTPTSKKSLTDNMTSAIQSKIDVATGYDYGDEDLVSLHFDGVVFTDEVSVSLFDFSSIPVICRNAFFERDSYVYDDRDMSFSKADFSGSLFDGFMFMGGWCFEGQANFSNAIFLRGASFSNAKFQGTASFNKAIFIESAWFDGCIFDEYVAFFGTILLGSSSFEKAHFCGFANFSTSAFTGPARFSESVFHERAMFQGASFADEVHFEGSAFCEILVLERAHFEANAWFGGVTSNVFTPKSMHTITLLEKDYSGDDKRKGFAGEIIIPESMGDDCQNIVHAIYANECTFMAIADFSNRLIVKPSIFENAIFVGRPLFHGAKLNHRIGFHGAKFLSIEYLNVSKIARRSAKRRRHYKRLVLRFLDRKRCHRILGDIRLYRTGSWVLSDVGVPTSSAHGFPPPSLNLLDANRRAAGLPAWRYTDQTRWPVIMKRWARQTEFSREKLSPNADDGVYEKVEAAFRTLKLVMESSRARLSESLFFRLELKARRERKDQEVRWWERRFSYAYSYLADYGNSTVRPVGWFIASLVSFSVVYLGWAMAIDPNVSATSWKDIAAENVWDAVRLSGSRMFPFGALGGDETWTWRDELLKDPARGLAIRGVATVQSLMALVLSFLFALAVRRRFQIT